MLRQGASLQALKVQYEALKTLSGNHQAQLQSTKAQLHHAEAASLQAQQRVLKAEQAAREEQHSAQAATQDCQRLRYIHLCLWPLLSDSNVSGSVIVRKKQYSIGIVLGD